MELMKLELVAVPVEKMRSLYRNGEPGFPKRLGFMHPTVAAALESLLEAASWEIVFSDVWRSSLASLARKYPEGKPMNKNAQYPAYSGHGFGFCTDIDVNATMKRMGFKKKVYLDNFFKAKGFYCHRLDGKRGVEDWHFNGLLLGGWAMMDGLTRSSGALEAMIEHTYGKYWNFDAKTAQTYLKFMHLYTGEIDGSIGPLSRAAIKAFQRAWRLDITGELDQRTRRTMAYRYGELTNPLVAAL